MKKNKKSIFRSASMIAAIIAMMLITQNSIAQGGPPGGNTDVDDTGTNDSIPLDGGLSILLIGAAAFGVKKLRDSKKDIA